MTWICELASNKNWQIYLPLSAQGIASECVQLKAFQNSRARPKIVVELVSSKKQEKKSFDPLLSDTLNYVDTLSFCCCFSAGADLRFVMRLRSLALTPNSSSRGFKNVSAHGEAHENVLLFVLPKNLGKRWSGLKTQTLEWTLSFSSVAYTGQWDIHAFPLCLKIAEKSSAPLWVPSGYHSAAGDIAVTTDLNRYKSFWINLITNFPAEIS